MSQDDDLHEALMTWGAYRSGYSRLGLGYGQSLLGRLIRDMKGTTCPTCIGRGKVRDLATQTAVSCPVCRGKGRILMDGRGKANPALIRGTRRDAPLKDEPEIVRQIDQALLQLRVRHRVVLVTRYVVYPRRNDSERRLKHVNRWFEKLGEAPISKRRMEKLLSEARGEVAGNLSGNAGRTR